VKVARLNQIGDVRDPGHARLAVKNREFELASEKETQTLFVRLKTRQADLPQENVDGRAIRARLWQPGGCPAWVEEVDLGHGEAASG
jgi:hypothetical protein